jgi:methyl-accepting chemotaxis protein
MHKSLAGKMLFIYIPSIIVILSAMAGIILFEINKELLVNTNSNLSTITSSSTPHINDLVVIIVANSLICLIVFILLVIFVTKRLKKIATGDLSVSITNSTEDEIGQANAALEVLVEYMQRISKGSARMADGDLTIPLKVETDLDVVGTNFNRMMVSLQKLINELKNEANRLANASEKLALFSQQTGRAASQISITIQQISKGVTESTESISNTAASIDEMTRSISGIADGAQEQANAVNKASNVTAQLTEVINRVNGNASVVVSEATRAAEVARTGSDKVKETVQGMENIQTTVLLSAQKVKEMGQRTLQIESIIETIDTIASQTNLLALNAAIEAARAGMHGKGFAVVADEVRKLADRSSDSTREIAAIIASIRESLNEAVSAMDSGLHQVESGVVHAHDAGKALSDILAADEAVAQRASGTLNATKKMHQLSDELINAMESVSSVVEQNNATTSDMSDDSHKVSQAIDNIASISEQNSAAVEQVSATAEELSAQADELSHSVADLSQMATVVSDLISRFKV